MPAKPARTTTWLTYNSLAELVEHVQRLPEPTKTARCDDSNRWAGGDYAPCGMQQALDLARNGWPEGVREAGKIAAGIAERVVQASGMAQEDNFGYDVTGGAFDAGAYLSGVPECWGTLQPQQERKAVRIVVNICASGGVPADMLLKRGAAIAALVLTLTARGFAVTVDVMAGLTFDHGAGDSKHMIVRVADASTGSPLDIDRVVFALAHPGMLRRINRALINGFRSEKYTGEGWDPSRPDSNVRPEGPAPDLYIGGVHYNERNRWEGKEAEAWVLAEYNRQTT